MDTETNTSTKPARRKIWRWVLLLLLIALLAYCASLRRSGLFNNWTDQAEALAEHERAWRERGYGRQVTRHQMLALVRQFDGNCITGESNWSTVPMDRRIDPFVIDGALTVDCHFVARGPTLLHAYMWAVILRPISSDELILVEFRRQRETL